MSSLLVSNCHIWDTHGNIIVPIHVIIIHIINTWIYKNGWFHNQFQDVTVPNIENIQTSEAKLRQPFIKKEPIQNGKMLTEEKCNENGTRL
jgi:hypothetical protein